MRDRSAVPSRGSAVTALRVVAQAERARSAMARTDRMSAYWLVWWAREVRRGARVPDDDGPGKLLPPEAGPVLRNREPKNRAQRRALERQPERDRNDLERAALR